MRLHRFILCLVLVYAGACSSDKKSKRSGGGEENSQDQTVEEDTTVVEETKQPEPEELGTQLVRVRDFMSIYNTFEALSGVNGREAEVSNNTTIFDYFDTQLAAQLPSTSDPETYSSASYVAAVKLAGEFCDAAWKKRTEDYQIKLFALDSADSPEHIQNMAGALAGSFWGYSEAEVAAAKDVIGPLVKLGKDINEDLVAQNANQQNLAKGVAVSMCSASLASIETVIH